MTNRLACSDGRTFDASIGACNHESLVDCADPMCPPTDFPTISPTFSPSDSPTLSPTGKIVDNVMWSFLFELPFFVFDIDLTFVFGMDLTQNVDSPTTSPTHSPTGKIIENIRRIFCDLLLLLCVTWT